jgi:hypothetical protein
MALACTRLVEALVNFVLSAVYYWHLSQLHLSLFLERTAIYLYTNMKFDVFLSYKNKIHSFSEGEIESIYVLSATFCNVVIEVDSDDNKSRGYCYKPVIAQSLNALSDIEESSKNKKNVLLVNKKNIYLVDNFIHIDNDFDEHPCINFYNLKPYIHHNTISMKYSIKKRNEPAVILSTVLIEFNDNVYYVTKKQDENRDKISAADVHETESGYFKFQID